MPRLVLVRGLPGAGKTTHTLQHFPTFRRFAADDLFEEIGRFEPKLLSKAHKRCLDNTIKALKAGENVVVHNTFTQHWEMKAYLDIPRTLNDVQLEVIHIESGLSDVQLFKRCTHDVPLDTIRRMRARWEPFDGERVFP